MKRGNRVNLHNGELYWSTTEYKELRKNDKKTPAAKYDVIVVGGGMSGALSAYTMKKQGLSVALIDKDKIGHGSTSANTGLLQYSNDIMLHELAQQIGEEDAVLFYKACRKAVEQLKKTAAELDYDCSFHSRKSLYFASERSDAEKLQKEFEMLKRYGFEVEFWDRQTIEQHYPFSKEAALITFGDAEVNPLLFSQGVIDKSRDMGVDLFEKVDITNYSDGEESVELSTSAGNFSAGQIIFAVGYDHAPFLQQKQLELNRSFVVTSSPIEDLEEWKDRALIWETQRPYLYLRTTEDNRIIAGGLDEPFSESGGSRKHLVERVGKLSQQVKALFPMYSFDTDFSWSAVFGESGDQLPFIGRHPKKDRYYYLLGYGGNGTVYSMLGSELLADLIHERPNSLAGLLKIGR